MLQKARNKINYEKHKEYLKMLEEMAELEKEGKKEEANMMKQDLIERLQNQLENCKKELSALNNNNNKKIDKSVFPKPGEILAESSSIVLKAFDESVKEDFLKVSRQCAVAKSYYDKKSFQDSLWSECVNENALCYSVSDKHSGSFIGYVGVKFNSPKSLELVIELLEEFRHKGYGYKSLSILMDNVSRLTDRCIYKSRVYPDNKASQALMKKLGARPDGIAEYVLHGKELEAFEEENLHLINAELIALADEFCVEPRDLLGHILQYRIEWNKK